MVERRLHIEWRAWARRTGLLLLALGLACEGSGTGQPGRIVQQASDPRCVPVGGAYPSGFDLRPGTTATGALMQFTPKALLAFDLSTSPPTLLNQTASPPFPSDSDGDGRTDLEAFREAGLCPSFNPNCIADPKPGQIQAVREDLVLLTTSDYEQVIFMRPDSGETVALPVRNPVDTEAHRAADWPLLPEGGTEALRTAISTQTCIYPEPSLDSKGDPIGLDPLCERERPSFRTRFTAATEESGGFLFVATSNLASSAEARFNPGSILVYRFKTDTGEAGISPYEEKPYIQTTDFNPTALAAHTTDSGRPLILITNTGSLLASGEILGESSVDVLDVESLQIVARYPLGRAAARGRVRIDPSGRIGLLGAESRRALYGIDLAALEDPALYTRTGLPPVDLDGYTSGFPDARIFFADQPLRWPPRPDGPAESLCPTRTEVDFSASGQHAYATDWCDGSLTVIAIDFTAPEEGLFSTDRFQILDRLDWFAPKTPELFGLATAPSLILGFEAESDEGPDSSNVAFILNEPEGQLCTARLDY